MTILSFAEPGFLGPGKKKTRKTQLLGGGGGVFFFHTKKTWWLWLGWCHNLKNKHMQEMARNGRSNEKAHIFCTLFADSWRFRLVQSTHLARAHHVKSKKYCNIWTCHILLVEEILHQLRSAVYPIIYKLLYISSGAGFLPSTVSKRLSSNETPISFYPLDSGGCHANCGYPILHFSVGPSFCQSIQWEVTVDKFTVTCCQTASSDFPFT